MKTVQAFIFSICSVQFAPAQQKTMTIDDLMSLSSVIDARISPTGDQVAYVVSKPSLTKNQHEASLFVVPASGGAARRLAESVRIFGTNLPSPKLRWSPDGAQVSFTGFSGEKPQVFAVTTASGETRTMTASPEGVLAYEWSPDGKSIAYLTREAMPAEEQQQRKDQSFVTHVGVPDRVARVAVVQPGGRERLLTPPNQYVESFSWSPDGKEIAYAAAPTTGFMAQYASKIYAVAVEAGAVRNIVDRDGMNSTPRYSPDGTRIAFVTSNTKISIMAPRGLAIASTTGGKSADVRPFPLNDAWVMDVTWAADGKSVFLLTTDGTYGQGEHMFEQPIVRVLTETGKSEVVGKGPAANYSLSINKAGTMLAFRRVGPRTMGDVFIHELKGGRETKLTDINPQLRDFALGDLKAIQWKSFDGMEIWGLLLTPPRAATKPMPLLVYCHGGPNGSISYGLFPQFMHTVPQVDYYPVEAMASAGYGILFPMPRGGAGYGEAGQRAIINDWGGSDYKDIMAGVDDLIAKGIADPARLGVMGASYGGYMTDWIVTQTTRFKAASAGASICDLADQYYLSDGGEAMVEYFGRPGEKGDTYATHSPITYVTAVTTPLLLQHGERDLRVPIANAWKFYRALKQLGKTVEFDIHPRSSHLFYEPMQEREAMRRNLEWFGKWLGIGKNAK